LIDSSPKFDFNLEEFSSELAHIDPIPLGIEKADFNLEEEIRIIENLLYDNSSSRPLEELNLEIADTILESLSPSPIPVEDSDSHMEEIDLFLATDDSMPLGIENDDYDSERDIRFLEELLSIDPLPLPEIVNKIFDPRIFIEVQSERLLSRDEFSISFIRDPLSLVFDTLLLFSSKNEDKVFNPGILSSHLLSHRDKIISDFSKSSMMISRGNISYLDVPYLHFYLP
ncbi:hypothetical protein Tco_0666961, partial [Tanacetum coccineum]